MTTAHPPRTPPSPTIHTYHCLCSTLLLATPYALPSLPRRSAPSLDQAHILPLPPLTTTTPTNPHTSNPTADTTPPSNDDYPRNETSRDDGGNPSSIVGVLPSLLTPSLRPARKVVIVRREDGFEKRKVWRCGRCGVSVGYEILGVESAGEKEGRVMYLLEGGLVETESMGKEEGEGG